MTARKVIDLAGSRPGAGRCEDVDGRRQRSERSRKQIVGALLKLIRAGDMTPGAAQVAEAAGVGLRTVFRHFEDMDRLYREMIAEMEAEIMPMVLAPYEARDWRGRLDELAARRAKIFERVLPLKVAGSGRRFRSELLMDDHCRFVKMESAGLKSILPKRLAADKVRVHALDMAMSFEAWRRLRQDQGLAPDDALKVTRFTVECLIGRA